MTQEVLLMTMFLLMHAQRHTWHTYVWIIAVLKT